VASAAAVERECSVGKPRVAPVAAVGLIMLAGAGLRLMYWQAPLLDAHRWRQVDTAAIARQYYENGIKPLRPEVNWGGDHGAVESEFPLLPILAALQYHLTGPNTAYARLIVVVFSTASLLLLYFLGAALVGPACGRAAMFLLALAPTSVFFGRTFMPDAVMVFWVLGAVLGFVVYGKSGSRLALAAGSIAAALACLTKLPAVVVFAPLVGAVWLGREHHRWRDPWLWVALAVPIAATVVWYWHAYSLYRETGLTFGVLGTTKTYPLDVAPGPWPSTFSKWSTVALLTDPAFYERLLARTYSIHLMPIGVAGCLYGLVAWRGNRWRLIADAWLGAFTVFVLAAGEGNRAHDYYQLPAVPAACLYFGAVTANLFDGAWIRQHLASGRAGLAAATLLAGSIGLVSFHYSSIVMTHFRPSSLDLRTAQAGDALRAAVPEDALVIVVDDYGINSPMLLYFAHRKGWSFDAVNLSDHVIDGLARRGARAFCTTAWSEVERLNPNAAAYLKQLPEIRLARAPADMVAFDLRH